MYPPDVGLIKVSLCFKFVSSQLYCVLPHGCLGNCVDSFAHLLQCSTFVNEVAVSCCLGGQGFVL